MSETNTDTKHKIISNLLGSLFWLFLLLIVILKFLVFQNVTVVGKSMMPNYEDGQLLLVNQISKNFKRGDVVAVYQDFEAAKTADYLTRFKTTFFLKRVIAMPGEYIEIIGGDVIIYNSDHIDGSVLVEDYIPLDTKKTEDIRKFYFPKTKIADDSYFVMGDNRSNSTDSRVSSLGPIKNYAMFGKEFIRFWPIAETELFSDPVYEFNAISNEIKTKKDGFIKANEDSQSLQLFRRNN
jgi:signal peptidase I